MREGFVTLSVYQNMRDKISHHIEFLGNSCLHFRHIFAMILGEFHPKIGEFHPLKGCAWENTRKSQSVIVQMFATV